MLGLALKSAHPGGNLRGICQDGNGPLLVEPLQSKGAPGLINPADCAHHLFPRKQAGGARLKGYPDHDHGPHKGAIGGDLGP